MKQLLTALPLCILLNGCSSPAATTNDGAATDGATAATSDSSSTATAVAKSADTPAATSQVMPNTAPPMGASGAASGATNGGAKNSKTAGANAPDNRYLVVDEAQPGMQPEMVAALAKVKVPPPPAKMAIAARPRLRLLTSKGAITVELDSKAAPLQVKSFVYLAGRKYFDGTRFHRFADLTQGAKDAQGKPLPPGKIIQGGDPLSKNAATLQYAGGGGPGYRIPRERNKLTHNKLVIAAARGNDPDSAGSQFYLTQDPVPFLDEGDGYTVFGHVVGGADVALKLQQDDVLKSVSLISQSTKR